MPRVVSARPLLHSRPKPAARTAAAAAAAASQPATAANGASAQAARRSTLAALVHDGGDASWQTPSPAPVPSPLPGATSSATTEPGLAELPELVPTPTYVDPAVTSWVAAPIYGSEQGKPRVWVAVAAAQPANDGSDSDGDGDSPA